MYAVISQGLHANIQFIAFLMLNGIISIFNKSKITLVKIVIAIHIPTELPKNNVQKMNMTHHKIDSLSHRYGAL